MGFCPLVALPALSSGVILGVYVQCMRTVVCVDMSMGCTMRVCERGIYVTYASLTCVRHSCMSIDRDREREREIDI